GVGWVRGICGHEGLEIRGRARQPGKAKTRKPRLHRRIGKSGVDFLVELVNDLGWRLPGRTEAEPSACLEAWEEVTERCDVRQRLLTLRGRHAEGVQLARPDVFHRSAQGAEEDVNLSAKQVSNRRRVTAIGNVQQVDPGFHLEQLSGHMGRSRGAW